MTLVYANIQKRTLDKSCLKKYQNISRTFFLNVNPVLDSVELQSSAWCHLWDGQTNKEPAFKFSQSPISILPNVSITDTDICEIISAVLDSVELQSSAFCHLWDGKTNEELAFKFSQSPISILPNVSITDNDICKIISAVLDSVELRSSVGGYLRDGQRDLQYYAWPGK